MGALFLVVLLLFVWGWLGYSYWRSRVDDKRRLASAKTIMIRLDQVTTQFAAVLGSPLTSLCFFGTTERGRVAVVYHLGTVFGGFLEKLLKQYQAGVTLEVLIAEEDLGRLYDPYDPEKWRDFVRVLALPMVASENAR